MVAINLRTAAQSRRSESCGRGDDTRHQPRARQQNESAGSGADRQDRSSGAAKRGH